MEEFESMVKKYTNRRRRENETQSEEEVESESLCEICEGIKRNQNKHEVKT